MVYSKVEQHGICSSITSQFHSQPGPTSFDIINVRTRLNYLLHDLRWSIITVLKHELHFLLGPYYHTAAAPYAPSLSSAGAHAVCVPRAPSKTLRN